MALIFTDSCGDDRAAAFIADRYDAGSAAAAILGTGRTGNGIELSTGILDIPPHLDFSFSNRQVCGFGVAREFSLPTALGSIRNGATPHVYAQLNSGGTISVIRFDAGPVGTILGTSTQSVAMLSDFFYLELWAKIDPSDGWYELWVSTEEGVSELWLQGRGINTSSDGTAYANRVRQIFNHSGIDDDRTTMDDFYIADDDTEGGTASIAGPVGPVHIFAALPSANGATNDFTATGAASNYQCVDEATGENGDTDYVASADVGDVDLYALPDLDVSADRVLAVVSHDWAKREDFLFKSASAVARVSAANYAADAQEVGVAYERLFSRFEKNPATLSEWTRDEVNDLQVGIEVAA